LRAYVEAPPGVMPAKAGIQYAASCRLVINVSEYRVTPAPAFAFAGDDDGTKGNVPATRRARGLHLVLPSVETEQLGC
jgi:hypothetical protein